MLIIPNFVSPFKIDNSENNRNIDRIAIINSYFDSLDANLQAKILVLDYDIKKNEISYTYDTIEYIKYNIQSILNIEINDNLQFQYYFLIGDDNLLNFDKWKNWEEILNLVDLVVAFRLENKNNIETIIKQKYSKYQSKIQLLENPIYDISATKIRFYLEELLKLNNNEIYPKLSKFINQFTIESYLKNKNPFSNKSI